MTDYIADTIYTIGHAQPPRKRAGVDPDDMIYLSGMRKLAQRLENRELYAFDVSAMRAAADLRIDTPERVERLVTAVFSEPRSLFFEVSVEDRDAAMSQIQGFFGHLQGSRRPATRFGVFVDILGGGKARVQPIWMHGGEEFAPQTPLRKRLAHSRGYPMSMHASMARALRLALSPTVGVMDISKHIGMARSEFDFVLKRAGKGFDPLLDRAREAIAKEGGVRAQNSRKDDFWRIMRFRDIVASHADPDINLGPVHDEVMGLYTSDMFDPVELGLHVVAMCAVLQADSENIAKTPREHGASRRVGSKRSKGKSSPGAKEVSGLSMVTLNILDNEVRQYYESGEFSYAGGASSTGGVRRHPVRGHLFLARNGKLVWRKAHWRGSLEGATLKKVVARGYKDSS